MYRCESWTIKKAEHQRIDAFLNCSVGEDSWESLGLQGNQTSQSWRKLTLTIHWKTWAWSWSFNTLTIWCKEPTHWKRLCCWERLKAKGEGVAEDEMVGWHHRLKGHEFEQTPGDGEGQGTLECGSPRGLQRVGHEWATEQYYNRTDLCINQAQFFSYQLIIRNFPRGHRCELRDRHQCNNTEWCGSQGYLFMWLICDFWT